MWKKSSTLLKSYATDFEILYGEKQMVYNVHQLTHLSQCVKKNGPLFAYSNYATEDYIGHLVTFVKGTTDVTTQICSRYLLEKNLRMQLKKSKIGRDYYEQIESKCYFPISEKINQSIVIGKPKPNTELSSLEITFIQKVLHIDAQTIIQEYRAAFLNNRDFYETCSNCLQKRTNDSLIFNTESKRFAIIQAIIVVREQLYFLIEEKYQQISDSDIKYIKFLKEIQFKHKLIKAEQIGDKYALIQFANIIAASKFPNLHERN